MVYALPSARRRNVAERDLSRLRREALQEARRVREAYAVWTYDGEDCCDDCVIGADWDLLEAWGLERWADGRTDTLPALIFRG